MITAIQEFKIHSSKIFLCSCFYDRFYNKSNRFVIRPSAHRYISTTWSIISRCESSVGGHTLWTRTYMCTWCYSVAICSSDYLSLDSDPLAHIVLSVGIHTRYVVMRELTRVYDLSLLRRLDWEYTVLSVLVSLYFSNSPLVQKRWK